MDVQVVRAKLAQVLEQMKELERVWCDDLDVSRREGHMPYPLQVALEMVDGLIERAPFQVGQRVALVRTPEIGPESGWRGCKHFLVQGAAATVRHVEFGRGYFSFAVTFDDESWIDRDGVLHPADPVHPGHFYFGERDLQRLGI